MKAWVAWRDRSAVKAWPLPGLLVLLAAPFAAADPVSPAPSSASRPASASQPTATSSLIITGTSRLSQREVRQVAGQPPAARHLRAAWARGARQRVVRRYHRGGYTRARAWTRVDDKGNVRLDVDEGRVVLTFVGADDFSSFLFRVDFLLVGRIYHRPTVLRALAEVKDKYSLSNAYHRVVEGKPPVLNGFKEQVPGRTLKIFVIAAETFGWKPKVSVSSSWGLTFAMGYRHGDLLFSDDRFFGELEMALPYREFIFEQEPTAQWVHGGLGLTYRLPRFLNRRLAVQLDVTNAVSRYVRSEELGQSYLSFRVDVFPGLAVFLPGEVTLKLGAAVDYTRVFDLTQAAAVTTPLPDKLSRARYMGRVEVSKVFRDGTLRLDQQDEMSLRLDMGASASGDWLLDTRFKAQMVAHLGRHDLLLRGRAVFMAGDVRFWDEVELAGDYLRCYFNDRYWVREALQVTVAFRMAVLRWFKLGVFHDASGFFDRSRSGSPLAAANAFGPGLHFLIFDLFSLDVYYAFGFSPEGFDHNLSFSLQRAF